MDGMTWDRYLQLSWYDRWVLHDELTDLIESTEPESALDESRPKRMRK